MSAAQLFAQAGMDGKEDEGRAACVESNIIVSSRRRKEDIGVELH